MNLPIPGNMKANATGPQHDHHQHPPANTAHANAAPERQAFQVQIGLRQPEADRQKNQRTDADNGPTSHSERTEKPADFRVLHEPIVP